MQDVSFVGSSLEDLRSWPKAARQDMGREIERVQTGLDPTDWKPMPSVGRSVREIRVHDAGSIYRSLYTTKIADVVYVLHVFVKKSRRTPTRDIRLARSRLKALARRLAGS